MLFQNKINLRYCASGWFYYRNIGLCVLLCVQYLVQKGGPQRTATVMSYRTFLFVKFCVRTRWIMVTSKRGAECKGWTFELWVCGSMLPEITCEWGSEGIVKEQKKKRLNAVTLKVILWNCTNDKPEKCTLAQDLNRNVTTNGNM
jgi:hypothetical protein